MMKTSKYRSRRAVCRAGHTHQSQRESKRCDELHLLQKAGIISRLEIQPKFELQPEFVDCRGKKHQAIHYIADFLYITEGEGRHLVVEDAKGYRTKEYRIKIKMFLYQNTEIDFREV